MCLLHEQLFFDKLLYLQKFQHCARKNAVLLDDFHVMCTSTTCVRTPHVTMTQCRAESCQCDWVNETKASNNNKWDKQTGCMP